MTTYKIGILIFDGVEELDFAGPWEVFTMSNEMFAHQNRDNPENKDHVFLVSETGGQVTCANGMRVQADYAIDTAPAPDVLLIPGGAGTLREMENEKLLGWISKTSAQCTWTASVCTGALLLAACGVAKGRKATTHWAFIDTLRNQFPDVEVLANVRYARDGNLVTAAGVSAGIDMALWLTGQLHSIEHARLTQRGMEYDPAPPYTADV